VTERDKNTVFRQTGKPVVKLINSMGAKVLGETREASSSHNALGELIGDGWRKRQTERERESERARDPSECFGLMCPEK
jgi:hypothetical protein